MSYNTTQEFKQHYGIQSSGELSQQEKQVINNFITEAKVKGAIFETSSNGRKQIAMHTSSFSREMEEAVKKSDELETLKNNTITELPKAVRMYADTIAEVQEEAQNQLEYRKNKKAKMDQYKVAKKILETTMKNSSGEEKEVFMKNAGLHQMSISGYDTIATSLEVPQLIQDFVGSNIDDLYDTQVNVGNFTTDKVKWFRTNIDGQGVRNRELALTDFNPAVGSIQKAPSASIQMEYDEFVNFRLLYKTKTNFFTQMYYENFSYYPRDIQKENLIATMFLSEIDKKLFYFGTEHGIMNSAMTGFAIKDEAFGTQYANPMQPSAGVDAGTTLEVFLKNLFQLPQTRFRLDTLVVTPLTRMFMQLPISALSAALKPTYGQVSIEELLKSRIGINVAENPMLDPVYYDNANSGFFNKEVMIFYKKNDLKRMDTSGMQTLTTQFASVEPETIAYHSFTTPKNVRKNTGAGDDMRNGVYFLMNPMTWSV